MIETPWELEPLKGKYYVTRIIDRRGNVVCEIGYPSWTGRKKLPKDSWAPSPRELEQEGPEFVPTDSHYEHMWTYLHAKRIVDDVNYRDDEWGQGG